MFEEALQQFEEAAYELTRLLPGDKRRPQAQIKYDSKKQTLLNYVKALEE